MQRYLKGVIKKLFEGRYYQHLKHLVPHIKAIGKICPQVSSPMVLALENLAADEAHERQRTEMEE